MAKKGKGQVERHPLDIVPQEFEPDVRGDALARGEKPGAGAKEPTMADVLARLDAIQRDNETLRTANLQLMATPVAVQPQGQSHGHVKTIQPISYDGLPDPTIDPTGYAKTLAERIRAQDALERRMAEEEREAQTSQQQRSAGLFAGFAEKYPDMAKHQDRLRFAANAVVERAKEQGVDLNRYMFTTREQFYADVAKEHEKVFGKGGKTEAEAEAEGEGDDLDEGRTAGLFGGVQSQGRATGGGSAAPRKETTFSDELRSIQAESKLF